MDILFDQPMADDFALRGLKFPPWVIGLTAKDVGLGVSKWWMLPYTHRLMSAAIVHDLEYENKKERTSEGADDRFKYNCLLISRRNLFLVAQSYLFYSIVVQWGKANWHKKNSKSYFRS